MIETFKKLDHQCPSKWLGEKLGLHPLFLRPKPRWKAYDESMVYDYSYWSYLAYMIVDKLTVDFPNFCEKMLSNKTSQGVGIIRMEEALEPRQYGMEVIGHMDLNSNGK